jgi:hypothetical protein
MVVYVKAGAAGQTLYYSDTVEPGGIGDVDVNVDLDPASDGVTVWGSDDGGTTPRILLTDSGGRQVVIGSVADGSAVAHPPVLTGGQDGTNVQSFLTDSTGAQRVVGTASDGAAAVGDPVQVAGKDGAGNIEAILTDTSGSPMVVGPGASGAARTGNPVAVAGSDGTNARDLLTDTGGRPRVVGSADAGAAPVGSPVTVAGSDGAAVRTMLTDSTGRPLVAQPTAADLNCTEASAADIKTAVELIDDAVSTTGAAVPAKGIQATGTDGTNARALKTDADGELQVDVLSSALPSGAATEATLADVKTAVQLIDDAVYTDGSGTVTKGIAVFGQDGTNPQAIKTDTTGRAEVVGPNSDGAPVVAGGVRVGGLDAGLNYQTILMDASGHQQVDVVSSALPTGAATEATLGTVLTSVQLIDDAVYTGGSGTPSKGLLALGSDGTNPRPLKTDVAGELQVDVLSSALPSGAATDAVLTGGTQKTQIVDGAGSVIDSTANALHVDVQASVLPTGAATESTLGSVKTAVELLDDVVYTDGSGTPSKGAAVMGTDGTNPQIVAVDTTGHVKVVGAAADGAAAVGNPVQIAGVDGGGDVQAVSVDSNGRLSVVQNTAADLNVTEASAASIKTAVELLDDAVSTTGSAVPAKGLQVTGTDGTNARALKTDTNGELQVDVLSQPALSSATDSVAVYDAVARAAGTLTNDDGTTQQEIAGLGADSWWYLHAVYFKRTAGSAANYQVRIAEDTGWTLGDIVSERYDSGSTAVGTQLSDQGTGGCGLWRLVQADANGKLYWETGFDAGADNNASFVFDFRKARAA